MMDKNYYDDVNHLIKRLETNKRARYLKDNSDVLQTYWEVGRILVEAQGGEARAKYGNKLILEWSKKLIEIYGNNYTPRKLREMRRFYLIFQKWPPVEAVSWSHYRYLISIEDENKRNYYINLCITRNLSKRELINEIKSNAYERLLDKPRKIEIIDTKNKFYNIKEHIRNPIIIKLDKGDILLKERDLQLKILAKLKNFFQELGEGYTFVGNEYKVSYGNKNYYIDILLFNYKLNAFVVVELKMRKLLKEDKAQIEFHNKTIGIIVSKYQDKYILNFVSQDNITSVTYELVI